MTDQPTEPTQAEAPAQTEADLDTERDDTLNVVAGDVNVTGQDLDDDDDGQPQTSPNRPDLDRDPDDTQEQGTDDGTDR